LPCPYGLLKGRANMKKQIAARTELNPAALPYHIEFLEFLKAEHHKGRAIIPSQTAADERLAHSVARHLGIFSDVIASNGDTNHARKK